MNVKANLKEAYDGLVRISSSNNFHRSHRGINWESN